MIRYRKHPAVVDRERWGGLTLYRQTDGVSLELNETGELVWLGVRRGWTVRRIARRLRRRFSVDRPAAMEGVERLLGGLLEAGFIHPAPQGAGQWTLTGRQRGVRNRRLQALELIGAALSPTGGAGGGATSAALMSQPYFDWDCALAMAVEAHLAPALFVALGEQELLARVPEPHRAWLAQLHRANRERNRVLRAQLDEAIARLNSAGIEPMPLKGALFLGGCGEPPVRQMGDLDLMVPLHLADRATAVLEAAGYSPRGDPSVDYRVHHHGAPLLRRPHEAPVELHRDLLPPDFAHLLPARRVWVASRRVECNGLRMHLPSATHRLLHNIVHATLVDRAHARGILPLRCLHELTWLQHACPGEIDWQEIREHLQREGQGHVLNATLGSAHRLFGMELPAGVRPGLRASLHDRRCREALCRDWLSDWHRRLEHFSSASIRARYHLPARRGAVALGRLRYAAERAGWRGGA